MQNDLFIASTRYCNYDHPSIALLAETFRGKASNNTELISAIFEHVRDEFAFGIDLVRRRASETVTKRYGACWNKALLLIALLRFYHIPCRLIRYAMQRNFQSPFVGWFYLFVNQPFFHCSTEVYLDGRWIELDPTVDQRLYAISYQPLNVSWNIHWDGKNDVVTFPDKQLYGPELLENIDSSIDSNLDNWIYSINLPLYRWINKKAWKRLGWDEVLVDRDRT